MSSNLRDPASLHAWLNGGLGTAPPLPARTHPPSTCSAARDGVGSAFCSVMLFSLPPSCACHGASLLRPPPASSACQCGLSRVGSTRRAPVFLQGVLICLCSLSGGGSRLYRGRTLCTALCGPSQTQQASPRLMRWAMFPAQSSGRFWGLPNGLKEAYRDVGGEKACHGGVMLMDRMKRKAVG